MKFRRVLKSLNFRQIKSLMIWFLKHPLFMSATVLATYQTFRISQKYFPNIHWKHNKANAFRHALWNVLIAKKSSLFSNNTEKILNWTKIITEWHEDFSPNSELPKQMDLHNNKVGRNFFLLIGEKTMSEITAIMVTESEKAEQINSINEISDPNKMVYLSDDFVD